MTAPDLRAAPRLERAVMLARFKGHGRAELHSSAVLDEILTPAAALALPYGLVKAAQLYDREVRRVEEHVRNAGDTIAVCAARGRYHAELDKLVKARAA